MVAASRSASTSAVMRFNSPIASTLASHSSRSLELGRLPARLALCSFGIACFSGATDTLISMITAFPVFRPEPDFLGLELIGYRGCGKAAPFEGNLDRSSLLALRQGRKRRQCGIYRNPLL